MMSLESDAMGGYGSGRKKRYQRTDECIQIDTKALKQYLKSPGNYAGTLTYTHLPAQDFKNGQAEIGFILERYAEAQDSRAARYPVWGQITLCYTTKSSPSSEDHCTSVAMVTTPVHLGGMRWWLISPCCGSRVRVLYISKASTSLRCRECHVLNYTSQCQGYRERRITREKYLLSHFGWQWAQSEYECMPEHYFKVTPEYELKKRRSILAVEHEMLHHLLAFNRQLYKDHIHALTTLKSDEDKGMYVDFLCREHGVQYALDLVNMLKLSIQIERDAYTMSPNVFERLYTSDWFLEDSAGLDSQEDDEEEPRKIKALVARQRAVEKELQELDEAA
jgi:hypothetical protein